MKKFSLYYGFKLFILTAALGFLGCQTTEQKKEPNIEQAMETQKAIIINLLNRGEPEKAFAELRPTLQRFPDNADFKTLMGLTQLALRNPRNAVKFLKEAHKIEPSTTTVLNLSSAHIENGQNVAALKLLKKHIKDSKLQGYQYPERIYHNVGLAYLNIKKDKAATIYFKKAINENAKFYLSLMQLGDMQIKHKKYKDGRNFYRGALQACNQCYEAMQSLSTSYLKEGNKKGAATVLNAYAQNKKLPNELRVKAKKDLAKINQPEINGPRAAKNEPKVKANPKRIRRTR